MSHAVTRRRPRILRTARQSWRSTGLGLRRMPAAFLITLLAGTLLECLPFVSRVGASPVAGGIGPAAIEVLMTSIAVSFARSLIAAPLAIAMHRFVLLGEGTELLPLRPVGRVVRFTLWLTAVGTISDVGLFLLATMPGRIVLIPVLQILGVVLAIRLILVFPQVALGATGHLARCSLSATRWQFWRIGTVSVVTILPIVAASLGIILLAHMLTPSLPWLQTSQGAIAVLVGLLTPLGVALGASSASWLFLVYNRTDLAPAGLGEIMLPAPDGTADAAAGIGGQAYVTRERHEHQ